MELWSPKPSVRRAEARLSGGMVGRVGPRPKRARATDPVEPYTSAITPVKHVHEDVIEHVSELGSELVSEHVSEYVYSNIFR